jgi:hypothetical protein
MMIGMGHLAQSPPTNCPNGYTGWEPYECCAPPGTPPAADPCSILNNPAFLQAQATDLGPVGSSSGGVDQTILDSLAAYPNNVQVNAIQCWNNPGATFTDTMGNEVTCPSASVDMNGIYVSAYSQAQLAAMLASTAPPASAPALLGNQPYAAAPVNPGTTPGGTVPKAAIIPPVTGSSNPTGQSQPPAGSSNTGANVSSQSNSTSSTTSSTPDLSFLTDDSLISGVPNWGVAFGALALLMVLPSLIGGHR